MATKVQDMSWRELTRYAGERGVYKVGMSRDEVERALGSGRRSRSSKKSGCSCSSKRPIYDDTHPIFNSLYY